MANRDVIVKLRLAGEEFDRDFKVKFQDLTDAAEKASAESGQRAGSSFGKSFGAAAGAAGAAIGLAINSAANLGQELASTSRQFNIGVESLQVWRQAAANAGVSANDFGNGLSALSQKIGEANAGNRQAQQGFVDLGIGFKTASGEARATDAVMLDLAKRISEIKDPAERARVGTQLLGDEFKALYPLLLDGSKGLQQASADLGQFGAMLSQKEIQELEKTNAKIEQMKTVLSIKIAGVVAENANAILGLADAIATLTGSMVKYASEYPRFVGALAGAAAGFRVGGPWGAAAGGLGGLYVGQGVARDQADANMDPKFRGEQLKIAQQRVAATTRGTVDRTNDPAAQRAQAELNRQTQLWRDAIRASKTGGSQPTVEELLAAPRVDAKRVGASRSGARTPTQSAAEKEAERAAKEAIRNEEQLRDAIARTLKAQQDSADVQRIRTEQGEEAAARAEAELGFLRQHPLAVNDTVESLAKALGITKALTDADRERLQLLIDQGNAAQAATGDAAAAKVKAEQEREAKKQEKKNAELAKREAERWAQEYERAINDVANIYETAFRGGTKDLWRAFKDEGTRMIAEIAAQWTLAMISGQPFNFNSAASGAFGRSPLSSIFFGSGMSGAANDNGSARGSIGSAASRAAANDVWGQITGGGAAAGGGAGGAMGGLGSIGAAIPQVGMFLAATQVSNMLGSGLADLLGVKYSKTGGSLFGALGGFIGGALKSTKRASVTVGNLGGTLGVTGRQGNSAARDQTATAGAGSLIDSIFQIADQLGGGVDASRGSVSFGMRKDSFRVDPTGRGITKVGNGAIDFGADQEAAMRFAIQDLIKDGVITGISQASQNLLSKGGDLDKQIEKALLIEQIPKLLKQRLDPLGSALDDLYDKFKKVNDALIEGSASAEQIAQARQLWELEKADAIASIGAASQSLKDFLASLNAGSNSPLSLREQREEAERQLQPFIAQITAAESARAEVDRLRASGASATDISAAEEKARTAAGAINQNGFTQASQLLLSISRQSNASSGAFFSDFDRIRALTGQAIGFVDQAAARPTDGRDPFSQAIAKNTQDAAYILADQTAILNRILEAINDNGVTGPRYDFITERRMFAL